MRAAILVLAVGLTGCATSPASAPAPKSAPAAAASTAPTGPSATHGGELFAAKCAGCHALDANKRGPALKGVVGRKAGSASDYAYSDAVANLGVTWDAASLDKWLTDPRAMAPGAKMGAKVEAASDRADLIAYLKTAK